MDISRNRNTNNQNVSRTTLYSGIQSLDQLEQYQKERLHSLQKTEDEDFDWRLPIDQPITENLNTGIIDPVRLPSNMGKLGLGKFEEDTYYAETVKKPEMEAIKIAHETQDEAKRREERIEREKHIKEELKEINRVFYCELCNKQYKLITEYENHLSSYDHNHKKRLAELKQMERKMYKGNPDDKAKKEQLRAQKELENVMKRASMYQTQTQPPKAPPQPVAFTDYDTISSSQVTVSTIPDDVDMEVDIPIVPPSQPPPPPSFHQPPPPPPSQPAPPQAPATTAPVKFSLAPGPVKFSLMGNKKPKLG